MANLRKIGGWGLLLVALNELRGVAVVASILGVLPGAAAGQTSHIDGLRALVSCAATGAACAQLVRAFD
jgi:hypothetical protein